MKRMFAVRAIAAWLLWAAVACSIAGPVRATASAPDQGPFAEADNPSFAALDEAWRTGKENPVAAVSRLQQVIAGSGGLFNRLLLEKQRRLDRLQRVIDNTDPNINLVTILRWHRRDAEQQVEWMQAVLADPALHAEEMSQVVRGGFGSSKNVVLMNNDGPDRPADVLQGAFSARLGCFGYGRSLALEDWQTAEHAMSEDTSFADPYLRDVVARYAGNLSDVWLDWARKTTWATAVPEPALKTAASAPPSEQLAEAERAAGGNYLSGPEWAFLTEFAPMNVNWTDSVSSGSNTSDKQVARMQDLIRQHAAPLKRLAEEKARRLAVLQALNRQLDPNSALTLPFTAHERLVRQQVEWMTSVLADPGRHAEELRALLDHQVLVYLHDGGETGLEDLAGVFSSDLGCFGYGGHNIPDEYAQKDSSNHREFGSRCVRDALAPAPSRYGSGTVSLMKELQLAEIARFTRLIRQVKGGEMLSLSFGDGRDIDGTVSYDPRERLVMWQNVRRATSILPHLTNGRRGYQIQYEYRFVDPTSRWHKLADLLRRSPDPP